MKFVSLFEVCKLWLTSYEVLWRVLVLTEKNVTEEAFLPEEIRREEIV